MLRMVLNARRRRATPEPSLDSDPEVEDIKGDLLEPWPDFFRRTAQWTEEQLSKAKHDKPRFCFETMATPDLAKLNGTKPDQKRTSGILMLFYLAHTQSQH